MAGSAGGSKEARLHLRWRGSGQLLTQPAEETRISISACDFVAAGPAGHEAWPRTFTSTHFSDSQFCCCAVPKRCPSAQTGPPGEEPRARTQLPHPGVSSSPAHRDCGAGGCTVTLGWLPSGKLQPRVPRTGGYLQSRIFPLAHPQWPYAFLFPRVPSSTFVFLLIWFYIKCFLAHSKAAVNFLKADQGSGVWGRWSPSSAQQHGGPGF